MVRLLSSLYRKKMVDKEGNIHWVINGEVRVPDVITSKNLKLWFPDDCSHLKVESTRKSSST